MSSIKPLTSSRKTGGRLIESRDLAQEYLAKELNRRSLLAGALAAASAAACSDGSNNTPAPPRDSGTPPADVPLADVPPARQTHLVGVGQHDDHLMAAERALAETAGFDFVQRGQRVYLKVNTNSGDPFPYSTSPDMIRWVVSKLRDRGAEVFIGDRSFWGDRNTMANFRRNGIADVAQELGVDLQVFGDTRQGDAASVSVDWMDLPMDDTMLGARSAFWDGEMRVPVMVAQADHIINMACVKTHFIATFTMSMKNIIGIINPADRARPNNLGGHAGNVGGRLYRQVAFMNKALPTSSLVVLDGWEALITGGPTTSLMERPSGAPANFMPLTTSPRVVIISRDRLAADLTGVGLLRLLSPSYEPVVRDRTIWGNRQISVAINAGVGITTPEQYDVGGSLQITGARDMMNYDLAALRELVTRQA